MCGIAGFLDFNASQSVEELQDDVRRMIGVLRHRGPDDFGIWVDAEQGVALGHRRLAVLDLTPNGRQPMVSACGRYVVVFNGEIYNFQEIKKNIAARWAFRSWRSNSDTEVLLAAVTHWGVDGAVKHFVGMFAIALWDRQERALHLIRDRMGEKPLYYGWIGNLFVFGSELKALRTQRVWRGDIDRTALTLYLRHNYVPAPHSIYQGVYKLLPGTILTVRSAWGASHRSEPRSYWSLTEVVQAGQRDMFSDTAEAADKLEAIVTQAIKGQMVADVPVGVFLSGGIDSSTIVALMQALSVRPVKSFTIGFREQAYDEAAHAALVARHLRTDHTELYVTPEDAVSLIPRLPQIYDEPFADSSQIPTFLVCELARRHVTVSLSGDGGDELFGGYNRYFWGRDIWRVIGKMPSSVRRRVAAIVAKLAPGHVDRAFAKLGFLVPGSKMRNLGDKLQKLAEILVVDSPDAMYLGLISHWKRPASLVLGGIEPSSDVIDSAIRTICPDFTQRMMLRDMMSYLPDDILVKVDRAAMAVSLETRVPMLDHRVVEFAWHLPLSMKIRHGQGKWLLRQVLYRYVPKHLVERPKTGFGVPIDSWLRGSLREWAEELLDEHRLKREGFFEPSPIREKWQEHLAGKRNWQYYLWDILMFQAWLESVSSVLARPVKAAARR